MPLNYVLRKYNPFNVTPLMKAAREGTLNADDCAKNIEDFVCTAEEYAATDEKMQAFVRARERALPPGQKLKGGGNAFMFFLLWKCNRTMFLVTCVLGVAFTCARLFNQVFFTQLMGRLAGVSVDLLFVQSSTVAAVALYCISSLASSSLNYLMDRSAVWLGFRLRAQLLWSLNATTLRNTSASISSFTASEVVLMSGYDVIWVYLAVIFFVYTVSVPIEFVILVVLTTRQVGVAATFISLIPLIVMMGLKLVMVKFTTVEQDEARTIAAKRFDYLEEGINSNKVVKFMGLEKSLLDKIVGLRAREERKIWWFTASNSSSLWIQVFLAPMMAWVAMYASQSFTGSISSRAIMTVLGYFKTITSFSIYKFVDSLQTITIGQNAISRHYSLFAASARLEEDKIAPDSVDIQGDDNGLLAELSAASFSWKPDAEPTLTNVTLKLPRGKLVGVVGPIGSGKSSLLLSLLGELERTDGSFTRHPDWKNPVSYMTQRRWLMTGTVRNNICFAEPGAEWPMEKDEWLQLVVDNCGLRTDIDSFAAGLDHFIGESGSSLSGGQRARLALARAVYSHSRITILDDPLCALDPSLAEVVFQKVIAHGGILHGEGRSVILVTTNPTQLAACDEVIVVEDGTVAAMGPLKEVRSLLRVGTLVEPSKARDPLAKLARAKLVARKGATYTARDSDMTMKRSLAMEALCYDGGALELGASQSLKFDYDADLDAIEEEDEEEGDEVKKEAVGPTKSGEDKQLISGVDIKRRGYFASLIFVLGWWGLFTGGVFIFAAQGVVYFWQYMVKQWLGGEDPDYKWASDTAGYIINPIWILSAIGAFAHFFAYLKGSTYVQNLNAKAIIFSPYSFFSVNSASRMYGNISQDSQLTERTLSSSMGSLWFIIAQLLGTVILTCMSLPYMVGLFVPLAIIYVVLQQRYSKCMKPMTNLEAVTRGPVQSHIAASVQGLAIVRAFHKQEKMRDIQSTNVAFCIGASLAQINSTLWLSFIANVIIYNTIIIVAVVLLAVALEANSESLGPVVLSNLMSLSGVIGLVAILISLAEMALIALQRLVMYADLPAEVDVLRRPESADESEEGDKSSDDLEAKKPVQLDLTPIEPPKDWPATGAIDYRNAYAAYTWKLPPALKNVNIVIPAGSSCALIGRSGSGKSTAFLALTGMIPVVGGAIEIDGIHVSRVGLKLLRAALAVVPQDPVLFQGTLRSNLDPTSAHADSALWDSLRAVTMFDAVRTLGGLDIDPVAAGMSMGQKQLTCLARALLRDTNVLLLDEANSSVDSDTEKTMNAIVAKFSRGEIAAVGPPRPRTVVEVAHRLSGVLLKDQVVVMALGEVVEKGSPKELAGKAGGEFASMLKSQGISH